MGIAFLIRPLAAGALFVGAAVLAIAGFAVTQADPAVLLSNQVNAVSAASLAAFLAILLWRKNTTTVLLQRELRRSHAELEVLSPRCSRPQTKRSTGRSRRAAIG